MERMATISSTSRRDHAVVRVGPGDVGGSPLVGCGHEGGDFVFTRPLRKTQSDLALGSVASVLRAHTNYSFALDEKGDKEEKQTDGDEEAAVPVPVSVPVRTAPFAPGTLQVFAGRYSLHAVTRTSGTRERLVAVLCFATEPNVRNTPAVQEMFWGRAISE